jgi:small conductance mechanosensitive channel
LLTLLLFRVVSGLAARVVHQALRRMKGTSDLLRDFLSNVTRRVVFFLGLVVALSVLGVNITPFLAALGAAGFVIGFALQGTLSNFASGMMILIYRPYDLGEVVTVAGTTGTVAAMTLVSTTLKLPDNTRVVIPNNSIWGDVITNVTGQTTRRVDMVFGCGYGDDLQTAQRVLEDIVTQHPKVHAEPAPVVKVHALADSSVNFIVRPWTATGDYWEVYWDVTRQVKERFDAEGLSIPYPQQDVHVHQVTGGEA